MTIDMGEFTSILERELGVERLATCLVELRNTLRAKQISDADLLTRDVQRYLAGHCKQALNKRVALLVYLLAEKELPLSMIWTPAKRIDGSIAIVLRIKRLIKDAPLLPEEQPAPVKARRQPVPVQLQQSLLQPLFIAPIPARPVMG